MADRKEVLREKVSSYIERRGQLYSPIDHPEFASLPAQHGAERFEPIRKNMPAGMRTALDIGSHWGYFAHKLEGLGLKVTAAENMKEYLFFLEELRWLYGNQFEIYPKSVFSLPGPISYDVVLALNIFHHFIKTKDTYEQFVEFLGRVTCKVMFFQSHKPSEGQMEGAFRNFSGEEFCTFIIERTPSLATFEEIGRFGGRPMYLLR